MKTQWQVKAQEDGEMEVERERKWQGTRQQRAS
jgi:hypothetical protein